jgi:hypothetical protein
MNNRLDMMDAIDLKARIWEREKITGPRIGDLVEMQDGTTRRLTADWTRFDGGFQVTYKWHNGQVEAGSFYLPPNGRADYSGSLDPAIPPERLKNQHRDREAMFWFFHHDERRAHNGVHVMVPCRVFREEP